MPYSKRWSDKKYVKSPGKITPVSADESLSGRQFFHGTNSALEPGTELGPGHGPPSYFHGPESHVYFTTHHEIAQSHANWRSQRYGGSPHVYQVQPQGKIEHEWPEKRGLHEQRATKATVLSQVR